MKVNATSHPAWPDGTSNIQDNDHNSKVGASVRSVNAQNPAQHSAAATQAGSSQKADSFLTDKGVGAGAKTLATGSTASKGDIEANALATHAVMGNALASKAQEFKASLAQVHDDIDQGRDTTDHMIAAAAAFSQALQLGTANRPSQEQLPKIDRLKTALQNAKGDETLDTLGQKANVDLSALTHPANAATTYGKYGKAASTYTRAFIFDEARFNNSAVLKNTPFAALQRPNQSVLDPLGPNGRLGILTGSRLNAAGSYFVKGGQSFLSGMEKLRKGQDPTKDFITAGATTGQGINELTVGIGTDLGNHLVKLQQAKSAAQAASGTGAGAGKSRGAAGRSESGATQGAAEPVAGPSGTAKFSDFDPQTGLADNIDALQKKTAGDIDDQLAQQQQGLREEVIAKLENTKRDVQQLELKDATDDLAPSYIEMQNMAADLKSSTADAARDAHENIKTIDAKAQDVIAGLKRQGFDTADAARQSGKPEAIELGTQLDRLAGLKTAAYDQFNSAMQERENALADSKTAFGDLRRLLRETSASERPSKIQAWSDKYTKFFAQRQANILAKTDGWPDWMKISKPLRMQMVPAAINTVLGAASFGVALDTYLQKQKAGTLTPKDRLEFGASVVNLTSGMIGFVPVIGPALSFALATTGLIVGGAADQYDARKLEDDTYNLKEKIRNEYNAKHPGAQIAEPFDGD